ncbi:hypothetical protein K8F61_18545 [Microbacterium resistens]|uniref:Minor tail protein n=1 Tax=Microbacterium resistens TaxID=156977 RepID=A0ABY3RUE0_9MICO|nr:hypothetical protein [Microbacterium resistens]UGS26585.1 hypothetical protein K8F61_18545 [Microbacterium resistens]
MSATEIVAIVVAVLAASGAWLNARYGRMARVEARLAAVEALNNRLWAYVRRQHDHAYRSGIDPLPIPDDLFGENE